MIPYIEFCREVYLQSFNAKEAGYLGISYTVAECPIPPYKQNSYIRDIQQIAARKYGSKLLAVD